MTPEGAGQDVDEHRADRMQAALPVVVATLRRVVQDLELTDDELHAVLGFLGEVARADELVLLSDVLGISRVVDDQTHAATAGTPSAVLGPFYLPGAPFIDNPGSIVRAGESGPDGAIDARGSGLVITGTVTDAASAAPIPGAVLDVWQADGAGTYSNEDPTLPSWHLRGRQVADGAGGYRIATLAPSHYTVKHDGPVGRLLAAAGRHPWRPAHIHFLVTADGYDTLVTQVYVADGPYLDDDAIDDVKDALIRPIEAGILRFEIGLRAARGARS